MATTKLWSNNESPSVLLVEQGSDPTTPDAGQQRVYMKADGLTAKDDGGTVRNLEVIQQALAADPASPVTGTWWLVDDGGSPASVALRYRRPGRTVTVAEITVEEDT